MKNPVYMGLLKGAFEDNAIQLSISEFTATHIGNFSKTLNS